MRVEINWTNGNRTTWENVEGTRMDGNYMIMKVKHPEYKYNFVNVNLDQVMYYEEFANEEDVKRLK